ncbi:TOB2 protein, partial [Pitta sordida]|nr:TOB2 protein [Pitta sordida]
MHLEIRIALNFILSYLYNNVPRRRADMFGEELECLLRKKYERHWYPEKPLKGSGYRCINIGEVMDPVVELAAKQSGLAVEDVHAYMPEDLSIWIDPFEVSYRIGEKGSVKILYLDDSRGCSTVVQKKETKSSFNTQIFVPISCQDSLLSNSLSPSFAQSSDPTVIPCSAQPITFTAATFAATKFGSTKSRRNRAMSGQQLRTVRSPTTNVLKHKGLSLSMPSLNFVRSAESQAPQTQLSPSAKEFVYGGWLPGDSSLFFHGVAGESQASSILPALQFDTCIGGTFDMAQVIGGSTKSFLEKSPFVKGLSCNLNTIQYPSQ